VQITGILKTIHPQVERGNFTSRKVWVTVDHTGQYPQTIELEVSQAKVNIFNNINPGTEVVCDINLRGRIWNDPKTGNDVCFNTLACWKVSVNGKANDPGAYVPPATHDTGTGYVKQATQQHDEGSDQLPF